MIIEGAWRGVAVVYANPMGLSTAERIENELRSKEVPTILLQYADTDLERLWECVDCIVFVMAVSGAVRTVCRFAKGKEVDPPVLVVDDSGKYVVPVLGAHWGANSAAREVAEILGATAVITTAAEEFGYSSVEDIAKLAVAKILNLRAAVKVNGAIVRGERVCVDVPGLPREALRGNFDFSGDQCEYRIRVSDEESDDPNTVYLKFLNVSLGVGAKEETTADVVEEGLTHVLARLGLSWSRVTKLSSIRRVVSEVAEKFGVPFMLFTTEQLESVDWTCLTPPPVS
ncbi:cobalamin biosynthesis protein CbiG [Sulfodiicoccus acidiphilus]|uniref:Cobalamin biosynthesis protein CbiG n=1 Tax=Sulfodiicoccus acidiphilus TaxID=1670455 RepID=A0A348B2N7_9CREN|nr:cobalamin biosynthesis protein [Sulfodiicoccus acidiphilus]BBD72439.1 cobalamin biosynthesis protein CbiG [Sulfodiicoccus acidiphilus]